MIPRATGLLVNPFVFFMLCVFQNKEDFKMGKKSQIWLFLMPVLLDCPV